MFIRKKLHKTDLASPVDDGLLELVAARYSSDTDVANPECTRVIVTEKSYEKLLALSSLDTQNEYELILTTKTTSKWLGYQGGTFSKATLVDKVLQYYDNPEFSDATDSEDMRYLCETVVSWHNTYFGITRIDPIIHSSRELYNTYSPTHRSSRGITGLGDRRPKENQVYALRLAVLNPISIDEIIAGMRYKDGKYRVIYIDSQANYYREAAVFAHWFAWWTSHSADMHQSDYLLAKEIVECNAKFSYAADYKGMDIHMRMSAVIKTAELFAACTQASPEELSYIKFVITEMANAPLIVADEIWFGEHSWFSGLYPTHDIEGFQNFSILLATVTSLGFDAIPQPKRLKHNQCFIKVCGDDSFILFGKQLSVAEQESLKTTHARFSAAFGQIMEVSKVDVSSDIVTFCKKTFALRQTVKGFKHYNDAIQTPIHKYPLNKAIHSIRRPENFPKFETNREYVIWTCSIMDLSYGMRDYKSVLIYLYQQNRELFDSVDYSDTAINTSMRLFLDSDWFFRNYVSFGLESSPTWQLLAWAKANKI